MFLLNAGFTDRQVLAGLLFVSLGCAKATEPTFITPIPQHMAVDEAKAKLGKTLFFDKRLSTDNSISCATCHDLNGAFGADGQQFSSGVNGLQGTRNSPTVFNAVFNFKQFWDGRAHDLVEQARGPVTNPVEMGMATWTEVVRKLADDSQYVEAFQQIYGQGINEDLIVDAIAEYEKQLITPNSPFDQFLNGDESAITAKQKKGYELFKAYGCVSCHQGKNVGGNMFQKMGVLKDINLQSGSLNEDLGRYEVTKNEWDKRVFKVPSLRLAVKTAPYFHDGSVKTIEEAVDIMIEFQLGRTVPKDDRSSIIAFLESLVGEIPEGVL
ncbi:cytochrome-c peroxidase [Marinicella meishanensis]|uniref:cytochrome-c peroxidase n=1 Tax=Marinicella meishanensis TaxID=2873263 RepID=UPI001CBF9ABC|nr:cytochrome-c peroxidase [Marinicella sp. NBU2979]